MRGQWNGLQALISQDCPYAYYVHCFAHRLQLALVAASKEVFPIYDFFLKLTFIVNIVGASSKRSDELKANQASDNEYLVSINKLKTGKGLNQIGTLQRAGDTRWSSHLRSVSSLITMFSATCKVLIDILEGGTLPAQRGDANSALKKLTMFEFVFTLHLMKKIMAITDFLCQALQCQSQDILNAMDLVSSTKSLLQQLRDEGWDSLFTSVKSFCEDRDIDVPNMEARYLARGGRARHQQEDFTVEHHYRIDIFYAAIDSQLHELNVRFNEKAMELVMLSSSLNPRMGPVKIDDICLLVDKYYPEDFTALEKDQLPIEIASYMHNIVHYADYKELSNISELCKWLVKTSKSKIYRLIFKVSVLVLTLPVSTATAERSFSAMSILKTDLRSKMDDQFLSDLLMMYIEREIAEKFSYDSIIDAFRDLKERRVPF